MLFPDSSGDELGEQLPKSMHARWKVLGLRKVDVASFRVTIVVGLGIGSLWCGIIHCSFLKKEKLAAGLGATLAPVGSPPVVLAAMAATPRQSETSAEPASPSQHVEA